MQRSEDLSLDELIAEVKRLQSIGAITKTPTRAQYISWVHGNIRMSNPDVTRAMVEKVIDKFLANKEKSK